MSWIMPCPACDHPIRPRPGSEGQWVRCPTCQHRHQVPHYTPQPAPPPVQVEIPAELPPAPTPGYPPAGFWRGLVVGVGVVVLVGVLALGIRGMWPSPQPDPIRARGGPGMSSSSGAIMVGPAIGLRAPPPSPPDALDIPPNVDVNVSLAGGHKMETAGTLPAFLALAPAPRSGQLLVATDDAELHVHGAADLAPRGRALLEGPASTLALDEASGRLYAAVGKPSRLRVTRLGERETLQADLVVYDVAGLLDGTLPAGTVLKPVARLEIKQSIPALLLSRDRRHLYVLTESPRDNLLMRADPATLAVDSKTPFDGGAGAALALSPDGSTLYALAGSRVTAFDAATWAQTGHVVVGSSPTGLVATDGGRVLLIDRRPGLQVLVVDIAARKALARWLIPVEGRPYLTASPDGKQIVIGSSAILYGAVWQFDCSGEHLTQPVLLRSASSDRHRLLRGPVYVSPDSRHVIFGNGVVLTSGV
jgi:hypothetical protein